MWKTIILIECEGFGYGHLRIRCQLFSGMSRPIVCTHSTHSSYPQSNHQIYTSLERVALHTSHSKLTARQLYDW